MLWNMAFCLLRQDVFDSDGLKDRVDCNKKKKKNSFREVTNFAKFVCVEVLRPSQPNGVMSSAVSLPNHTFTGQA